MDDKNQHHPGRADSWVFWHHNVHTWNRALEKITRLTRCFFVVVLFFKNRLQKIQKTQKPDYVRISQHSFHSAESWLLYKQERTDLLKTTAWQGKNSKYSGSFPHTHISTSNDNVAFWENTNLRGHMPQTHKKPNKSVWVLHISKN